MQLCFLSLYCVQLCLVFVCTVHVLKRVLEGSEGHPPQHSKAGLLPASVPLFFHYVDFKQTGRWEERQHRDA